MNLTSKTEEVAIKFMSYNIHHGVGLDGELSLERIAQVMRDANVEIIGVQEVDKFYGSRSNYKDQAKELSTLLGYYYVYGANLSLYPEGGHDKARQYGIAILSKYPIIESENIELSSYGNEPRGLLRTKIDVGGILVSVFNTHLGLDTSERLAQIKEITRVTSSFVRPRILLGDFNAEPNSEEIKWLLHEGDFVDCFKEIENAVTFPADNPNRRIDYILTSKSIKFSNQNMMHTQVTDHLPITIKLYL
ncbi:endonuclease/exonuclease/phosphatase family protein [Aquibacillus sp. 3ASR75-11]|uniref:Endonuclease/exonuclease/phosphatase family protein n=1 Tax=Terrihalobacillus insolitus TaxID=2950438 RepID=A0A9X4AKJ1_9BACI|nr:endonuclease/exonuclease/phosphatase family protein [Terrihalobacillus insolitus]MDC3412161.1 endonuclease/exonuclease/phosphatase family protein [Terrihalobacillus insolitus]MDC3423146.1 endonuclease/exonuclease/phosphatase family protein [Terrihalobacillus insolitus]